MGRGHGEEIAGSTPATDAPVSAAEALARAQHPERDAHSGDWGPRRWSQMRPEWQEEAVREAGEEIARLAELGYVVVPKQ